MSSSRSIAAARNRRAGEQQQPSQMNRPGTSIASQSAFSQQPQGKRSVTAPNSTPNVPVTNYNAKSNAKLSISDAIGLITLRLGRVEQIIMEAEHNGGFNTGTNIPDNAHLVDKSVINSIVNRLDSLEKKEKDSSNNQQTNKLETEIRDIKDLLMSQMVKYEKFTLETNKRFDDVDEAFVEIEKQQEALNYCNTSLLTNVDDIDALVLANTNVDVSNEVQNTVSVNDTKSFSGNLKSAIEQDLANSTNL
jgi:vacuolar-type H+-ATPase subunit I/STV1